MSAIYKIDQVLLVPKNVKNNLEYFDSQGLTLEEIDRLRNYIDGNPFTKNDRFYLLSKLTDLPPSDEQQPPPSPPKPKPRPPEYTTKTLYYTQTNQVCEKLFPVISKFSVKRVASSSL